MYSTYFRLTKYQNTEIRLQTDLSYCLEDLCLHSRKRQIRHNRTCIHCRYWRWAQSRYLWWFYRLDTRTLPGTPWTTSHTTIDLPSTISIQARQTKHLNQVGRVLLALTGISGSILETLLLFFLYFICASRKSCRRRKRTSRREGRAVEYIMGSVLL